MSNTRLFEGFLAASAKNSVEDLGAANQTNEIYRFVAFRCDMGTAYQTLVTRMSVWIVIGRILVHDTNHLVR